MLAIVPTDIAGTRSGGRICIDLGIFVRRFDKNLLCHQLYFNLIQINICVLIEFEFFDYLFYKFL